MGMTSLPGLAAVDVVVGVGRIYRRVCRRGFRWRGWQLTSLVFMFVEVPEPVWKNVHDELMGPPLALDDFLGGLLDGIGNFGRDVAEAGVGGGGVLFDEAEGLDELAREAGGC